MATPESVKAKIQGLVDKSNATTGNTDTDLTTAVDALVAGFGQGGGSLDGFHAVRFFNDDGTTLLYTVYVPSGSSAIYAGETPVSTENASLMFQGFEPAAVNVTADLDCYAVYEAFSGTLEDASWETISQLSAMGVAENYFAVGDKKTIHVNGTVGKITPNADYQVYIIGIDHNSEIEGNGIHFRAFMASNSVPIALTDGSKYGSSSSDGTKYFNVSHWGGSHGGWAGCDLRYDILGSTDVAPSGYGGATTSGRVGYDATETCATNPVANTLMAALPADLRSVMKPMIKYTDNVGAMSKIEANVTKTIDYLPLLSVVELNGNSGKANTNEAKYQKQYEYYVNGNSMNLYKHHSTSTAAQMWYRSPSINTNGSFCLAYTNGSCDERGTNASYGISPIFKV